MQETNPSPSQAPFSALQLEILKLYGTDMSQEDLLDLKRELGRFFATRATQAADRAWDEKGLTPAEMDAWLDAE